MQLATLAAPLKFSFMPITRIENAKQQVAAFEEDVAQLQTVDKVISVVGLLRHLDQQVGGKGQLGRLLPWLKLAKGHGIERLVDLDRGVLRLAVRLKRYGMRETHDTGRQIARIGRRHLGDQTRLEITGLMFLLGGWLDSILVGQRNGILVSLIVIALMMVIGTRSLRVGLWSMVPNVLPLLMVAGYVGAFWEQIDSDTLVIAMLAIGIGVDDTIHFLMRYRLEAARCKDRTQALRATYRFAGRAIVITSVILCLGFLPFATSDYFSIRIMGTLLPAVLIVALLADLLLVPALIQVGWMAYPANNGQPPQGPVSEESPDIPLDRAEPPR